MLKPVLSVILLFAFILKAESSKAQGVFIDESEFVEIKTRAVHKDPIKAKRDRILAELKQTSDPKQIQLVKENWNLFRNEPLNRKYYYFEERLDTTTNPPQYEVTELVPILDWFAARNFANIRISKKELREAFIEKLMELENEKSCEATFAWNVTKDVHPLLTEKTGNKGLRERVYGIYMSKFELLAENAKSLAQSKLDKLYNDPQNRQSIEEIFSKNNERALEIFKICSSTQKADKPVEILMDQGHLSERTHYYHLFLCKKIEFVCKGGRK